MHYATKMRKRIAEIEEKYSELHQAIWWAKTEVLGKEPGTRGFNALVGHEEGIPLTDVNMLREIILKLPL